MSTRADTSMAERSGRLALRRVILARMIRVMEHIAPLTPSGCESVRE